MGLEHGGKSAYLAPTGLVRLSERQPWQPRVFRGVRSLLAAIEEVKLEPHKNERYSAGEDLIKQTIYSSLRTIQPTSMYVFGVTLRKPKSRYLIRTSLESSF